MFKVSMILFALVAVCCAEQLVGGRQPMSLDDPKLPQLIEFAVSKINENALAKGADTTVGVASTVEATSEIISAESQVVAGVNYYITFKVKDSTGETKDCSVVIYQRPWEDSTKLTSSTC